MIIVDGITLIDCRQSYSATAIVKVSFQLFGTLPGSSRLHFSLACQALSLG